MLTLAATQSGGSSTLYWLVPVLVFMALCLAASFYRLRRRGPGPAVNYVPKPWRQPLNRYYESKGWQQPFDPDGDRNPDRTQL